MSPRPRRGSSSFSPSARPSDLSFDPQRIAGLLRDRLTGSVETGASLAAFTTFRVGGPADVLVEAASEDDLRALAEVRAASAPTVEVAIVGRGSNLLVSDDGFRGIAVRLGRPFREHSHREDTLSFAGAVYLPAGARLSARVGLAGFEFAAEIPATFGGAVRMNAGAHHRSIADVLVEATTVDLGTGARRDRKVGEMGYSYRTSTLGPEEIVTAGTIRLIPADGTEVAAKIAGYLRWRREHQPGGRSAGSVFKNPPEDSAGRLIESAGAKGTRIGGAQISPMHANFIVADPGASAGDVYSLIEHARILVRERTGVDLEPEVRFLGRFDTTRDDR